MLRPSPNHGTQRLSNDDDETRLTQIGFDTMDMVVGPGKP